MIHDRDDDDCDWARCDDCSSTVAGGLYDAGDRMVCRRCYDDRCEAAYNAWLASKEGTES